MFRTDSTHVAVAVQSSMFKTRSPPRDSTEACRRETTLFTAYHISGPIARIRSSVNAGARSARIGLWASSPSTQTMLLPVKRSMMGRKTAE